MIEGAIFDLDGTLLDSMGMWMNVIYDYLHEQGRTPKDSLMDDISTMSLTQAGEYCRAEYDLPLTGAEIVEGILARVAHFYMHEAQPIPGVRNLLDAMQAKGVRMCVATASDHTLIAKALERCGLSHYFSQILDCIEVGHSKNEPHIYRESLAHLGTDKAKTIVFEDATHAIETAKKDGFLVASIYSPYEKDADVVRQMSDIHIDTYAQLEHFWKFADNL